MGTEKYLPIKLRHRLTKIMRVNHLVQFPAQELYLIVVIVATTILSFKIM